MGISLQTAPFKLGKSMADYKEQIPSDFSNLHDCAFSILTSRVNMISNPASA